MEIFNIFLAGSILLSEERALFRSISNKLQADYCRKGKPICINITTYENFTSALTDDGQQKEYDEYIKRTAQYAFFILDNAVGGITMHEFNIAYDSFQKQGSPTIFVLSRTSEDENTDVEAIRLRLMHDARYFITYKDRNDLALIISDQLRSIVEEKLEKRIIEDIFTFGTLNVISDSECTIYDSSHQKIGNALADTHTQFKFISGVHTLEVYSSEGGFKRITVKITPGKVRDLPLNFKRQENVSSRKVKTAPNPDSCPKEGLPVTPVKRMHKWGGIVLAGIVVFVAVILIICLPKPTTEQYLPDEIEEFVPSTYNLAMKCIEEKDFKKAEMYLRTTINNFPKYTSAYVQLASIFINKEEYNEAEQLLEIALELNPSHEWALDLKSRLTELDHI